MAAPPTLKSLCGGGVARVRERFLAIPNNSNTHTSFGAWSPVHARARRADRVPTGPKKEKKKEMGHPRSQHFVLESRDIESVTRREGRWGFSKVPLEWPDPALKVRDRARFTHSTACSPRLCDDACRVPAELGARGATAPAREGAGAAAAGGRPPASRRSSGQRSGRRRSSQISRCAPCEASTAARQP